MNNLASAYQDAGRLDEAVALFEETLKRRKDKLPPDHPETLTSMDNLAQAYQKVGRLDEALALFEETVKRRKTVLGPDHVNSLTSMNNLALAYRHAGRLAEAVPLIRGDAQAPASHARPRPPGDDEDDEQSGTRLP